jgi:hypothetical protein
MTQLHAHYRTIRHRMSSAMNYFPAIPPNNVVHLFSEKIPSSLIAPDNSMLGILKANSILYRVKNNLTILNK